MLNSMAKVLKHEKKFNISSPRGKISSHLSHIVEAAGLMGGCALLIPRKQLKQLCGTCRQENDCFMGAGTKCRPLPLHEQTAHSIMQYDIKTVKTVQKPFLHK